MSLRRTVLMATALALAACGGETSGTTVVVSAAASLTDAFGDIAVAFEAANPDISVELNIGGSSALREQILEGARIDVFAAADVATMEDVVASVGVSTPPVVFARNSMAIAVPRGNPASIAGLEDFADPARFIGLCNPEVPCGRLAREVLAAAGVEPSVDTEEPDVRALLTKIATGELDAGLVYVSDVGAAGVDSIDLGPTVAVTTEYPIAVLARAPSRGLADRFVEYVLSAEAQRILAEHGFAAA